MFNFVNLINMRRLTTTERENCIRLLNEGMSKNQIARIYDVSRKTIYNLNRRVETTGTHNYGHGGGHPKKINQRTQRILMREVMQNKTKNSRKLNDSLRQQTEVRVSDRTVRRTLNKNNLR